ncbi:uncharacterized protein [Zea mays]|uniref:Inositol polyphosphate-related phosphatase domain-containing protein n=3 Tax=Zea mays TaxID=4577 RepID=A0A804LU32_MAIZE|nr:uncharacterized protein LOC103642992 isoform X2 [Zea mays]XP_023157087.1 uncharacterized protein LOC103642992 isoform X2 [Zea mays]|eukprot:XP_020402808.1 uncharacterized protein LOC103642992 isoform X2 [Zea mays]
MHTQQLMYLSTLHPSKEGPASMAPWQSGDGRSTAARWAWRSSGRGAPCGMRWTCSSSTSLATARCCPYSKQGGRRTSVDIGKSCANGCAGMMENNREHKIALVATGLATGIASACWIGPRCVLPMINQSITNSNHTNQLNIQHASGSVFKGWSEEKIYFAPTYNYSCNSDSYAGETATSKKKRRTPAWCDRILWHGDGIAQLSYFRGESQFSDHRPVCGTFTVEVKRLDG